MEGIEGEGCYVEEMRRENSLHHILSAIINSTVHVSGDSSMLSLAARRLLCGVEMGIPFLG
jgi:hypothetical protein